MSTNSHKFIKFLPLIIFLLAFGWRLVGLNSQGETWDEIAYYNASKSYMSNIKNAEFAADEWQANKEHPPIAKYIYGSVSIPAYLEDEVDYTNGRAASALMGALTVLLIFYLAKDLFSTKVGVLSAVVLTFMPHFVGLNKVYGLDTPTTLFFVLTVYLFVRAILNSSRPFYLLSGLALGLAIATRYNNALLFLLLPIIFFILKGKDLIQGKDRKLLWYVIIIPAIAALTLFISWPWLWGNTIDHWNQTIGHWGGITEIFLGEPVTPGLNYYLVYFAVSTPVLILLLLVPFFIDSFKNKNKGNFVILAWFLVMFLVTASPTKQNGVRYIIAIYPAVAIMASLGFFYLFNQKKSVYVAALILAIYLLTTNVIIHPYYLTYFNELVGGPYGVYQNKLFPIAYWGEGVQEACEWISDTAPEGSTVSIQSSPDHTTGGKLRSDLILNSDNPDYIVLNLNSIWYNQTEVPDNYQLVHTIESAKVPFIKIYKKKD